MQVWYLRSTDKLMEKEERLDKRLKEINCREDKV